MNADKRGYEVWNKKPNSLVRRHPRLSAFIRGEIPSSIPFFIRG